MKLKVEFIGEGQTNPYLIIPLDQTENFEEHKESLDDFIGKIDKDRVYTLQLKIDDDSSPGTIELDDISLGRRETTVTLQVQLPENAKADSLTFKYKANADSESESNTQTPMKLKVEFIGEDQTNPYLIIPLEHYENFEEHKESLDDFIGKIDKGRVYTLQLKIDDDSSLGTIELDDVDITYRVIATEDVVDEDEVIVDEVIVDEVIVDEVIVVDFLSIALGVAVIVVIVVVAVLIITRAKKRRNLGAEDK